MNFHSPYGVRCHSLHDRRIARPLSKEHVSIECKEFPIGGKLHTTINVDRQYSTKVSEIQHGPFGIKTQEMLRSFDDLSKHVCNKTPPDFLADGLYSDEQRLQVALVFAKDRSDKIKSCFQFKATHIITEPSISMKKFSCMQIQSKVFDMSHGQAIEVFVPPGMGYARPGFVTVREIAFCQDARHDKHVSEPAPALFFNIPDAHIKPSTATETKQLKRSPVNWKSFSSYLSGISLERPFVLFYVREGGHCGLNSFMMDILTFELAKRTSRQECEGETALLRQREINLGTRFIAIQRALKSDKWSPTRGSFNRMPHHNVPSSESLYIIDANGDAPRDDTKLWEGFTSKPWQNSVWGDTSTTRSAEGGACQRLRTLKVLSEGCAPLAKG